MPITISSKRHLFRRCGVAHPKQATEYPADRFTKEELDILQAEPMLSVTTGKVAAKEPAKKPDKEPGVGTMAVNAAMAMAMIRGAASLEELESMIPLNEHRSTVLDAVEAKKAELAEDDSEEALAAERQQAIVEAIGKLDKDNPDHWTTNDKPQVGHIEGVLGYNISADERDHAWESMQGDD